MVLPSFCVSVRISTPLPMFGPAPLQLTGRAACPKSTTCARS